MKRIIHLYLIVCCISLLSACAISSNKQSIAVMPTASEDVITFDVAHVVDEDIWQRLRQGFAMADIANNEVIQQEKMYLANRERALKLINSSNKYIHYILEEIEQRQLPTELVLLPFVESAFNPLAVSSAKAAGMWQFMPATGKHFNLVQNTLRDERRDIVASTDAALDYLTYLHEFLDDWHLALAGYNWGEGNVQRAVAKNKRNKQASGYLDIKMPDETRKYVPRLQALKNIINNPSKYNITLPRIQNQPYFSKVTINHDIDIDLVIKLAEISLEEFKDLNPAFDKPVIFADGTPQILIPTANISQFKKNLQQHLHSSEQPLASWTIWLVPKNMTTAEIAKQLSLPENEIKSVNNIRDNSTIKAGSALLIHRNASNQDKSLASLVNSHNLVLQTLGSIPQDRYQTVRIKVKAGDTLGKIAQNYKVKVKDILRWNKININQPLRIGQVLLIHANAQSYAKTKTTATSKAAPRINKISISVNKGDTISAIALRHKVTVADLMRWNQLKSSNQLRAGQKLNLYKNTAAANSSNSSSYQVKSGDTLGTIAQRQGVSVTNLIKWNNLKTAHNIRIGQNLKLTAPAAAQKTYQVKPGDTLSNIAQKHRVSLAKMMQLNQLSKTSRIKPGQKILIP